jgi:hypothetical protein
VSARDKPSLYVRVLRLERVRPGAFVSFLLFECAITVAVLLALAELVSWWAVVLLPLTIAAAVKINDLVAGTIAGPRRTGAGQALDFADLAPPIAPAAGGIYRSESTDADADYDVDGDQVGQPDWRQQPSDPWAAVGPDRTDPGDETSVWSHRTSFSLRDSQQLTAPAQRPFHHRAADDRLAALDPDTDEITGTESAPPPRQAPKLQLHVVLPNPDAKDERGRNGAALVRRTGNPAGTPPASGRHARDGGSSEDRAPAARWTTTYGERRNEIPGRRRAATSMDRDTTAERRSRDANAKQARFS